MLLSVLLYCGCVCMPMLMPMRGPDALLDAEEEEGEDALVLVVGLVNELGGEDKEEGEEEEEGEWT